MCIILLGLTTHACTSTSFQVGKTHLSFLSDQLSYARDEEVGYKRET